MREPRNNPTPKIEVALKIDVKLKCPYCGEVIKLPEVIENR